MTHQDPNTLHYPLGDALPSTGRTLEVAPGVRWVRMGLPFELDHINLWLLRDRLDGREGWTVVDCGVDNPATREAWAQVFEQELQGLPVLRVVVTHMHPDHIGLAHWITQRFSTPERECRLWISATDWYTARLGSLSEFGVSSSQALDFFRLHGITDPEALQQMRSRRGRYRTLVPAVPERFGRLMDGHLLTVDGRAWECIAGYGHAPEHMSLWCADLNVLISGDMVLPRISTNVSVFEGEPEAQPLTLFLRSLEGMRRVSPSALVLPSHGKPFTGLHVRIQQLLDHHAARLEEALAACQQADCCAADLLPVLFRRPLDAHQKTFAMGEAVAHLHHLVACGQVVRQVGADGVIRFRAT